MGNHRFKLSDMMPNAWFYKLRDMSKPKTQNPRKLPSPPPKTPRKSYYHTAESRLVHTTNNHNKNSPKNPKSVEPPRRSSKKRSKRKTIYMPSPKQITPDCIFQDPDEDNHNIPVYDFQARPDEDFFIDGSVFDSFDDGPNHHHRPIITEELLHSKFSSSATDIFIDVTEKFDTVSEPDLDLPPVATRPPVKTNNNNNKNPSSSPGQKKKNATARKSISRSGGARVKIYGNRRSSGSKKTENGNRKSSSNRGEKKGLFKSESCAVVKASVDPERDFRESMMEMIVENNIRGSKDLEELLACYLSLNSNQYHGLIIKAFEQIWFNMPQTHF